MSASYKLYGYDVWGNKRDGYEVNDVLPTGITIELPDEATDRQIVKALKDCGYLRRNARYSSFEVDGEADYRLIVDYTPTSYPVCELLRI